MDSHWLHFNHLLYDNYCWDRATVVNVTTIDGITTIDHK